MRSSKDMNKKKILLERPLTGAMRPDGRQLSLKEYEEWGGYQALRKALTTMTPQEVLEEVKKSNLFGRGGAGFPAGRKWESMPPVDTVRRPRYLISNADEMEPGTFKDRLLIEGNPHQLIEGMILSSYAVQADIAYVFMRWAYNVPIREMKQTIAEAYERGYAGKNILKSGYSLELLFHVSAGRYICGEQTSLLNAMEGKRGIPRPRPPHTTDAGLWGKPTVVNNVETLSCVPHIINNGAEWFRGLSRTEDSGTKIYGVTGKVKRPGAWELPMGTSIREIIEEHAGGMSGDLKLRGLIPGGASTAFLLPEHLDIPMDFKNVEKAGSRLGTGTMVVLDDRTCPVGFVLNLEQFFARESCGWCTPCREGLAWTERVLTDYEEGKAQPEDLETLESLCRMMGMGHTFCVFAPGAAAPLQSALKYFREDFENHVRHKRCQWR
jgi:NADH-quinone oxidoreductase subunit F